MKYAIGFGLGVLAMWVAGPYIRRLVGDSALAPYARRLPTDIGGTP